MWPHLMNKSVWIHVRIQEDLDDKLDRESRNSSNNINNNGGGQSQSQNKNHALSFKRTREDETFDNDYGEDVMNPNLALFNSGSNTDSQQSAHAQRQQGYQRERKNNSSHHTHGRGDRNAHHRGGRGYGMG